MKKILVTGCGRSGTQYMNAVFNALGIKSRHERVYTMDMVPSNSLDQQVIKEKWEDYNAECSWTAVPFLPDLDNSYFVIHLLRNPLSVIRCWASHPTIIDSTKEVYQFLVRTIKFFPIVGKPSALDHSVYYWYFWNKLIEENGKHLGENKERLQIEMLLPFRLQDILRKTGREIDIHLIKKVLEETPRDIGACPDMHIKPLDWDFVEERFMGPCARRLAEAYGYDTNL